MTDCYVKKLPNCALAPASFEDQEVIARFKTGEALRVKLTRPRNYKFLRKFFALVNFAYDYWEPPIPSDDEQGVAPEKNLDRFRKDLVILAGYYDASYRLDGSVRIEAQSISFASMSEDEFERLYSKVIDVILAKVCPHLEEEELRGIVEDILSFT